MGYEEFYKEFILVASNYIFNKHLCDALIMEIIELNNTKFTFNDYQDSGFVFLFFIKLHFFFYFKFNKFNIPSI